MCLVLKLQNYFIIWLLIIITAMKAPVSFDMLLKKNRADLQWSFAGGQTIP